MHAVLRFVEGQSQFQIARHAVKGHDMNDVLLHRTEHPLQHIIEMHTDIGAIPPDLCTSPFQLL